MFIKLFDHVGNFGPVLLFILSIFLLHQKKCLLYFYIFGSILSIILNILLKILIKEPRPKSDIKLNKVDFLNNKKRSIIDKYGMPSGHSQSVSFSLSYIILSLKENIYIYLLYLIISFLTCIQRIKYKNHTYLQVVFGLLIGFIVAFITYIIYNNICLIKM